MRFIKSFFKTVLLFIILIAVYVIGVNSTGELADLFSLKNGFSFSKLNENEDTEEDIIIAETAASSIQSAKAALINFDNQNAKTVAESGEKIIKNTYINAESQNFEKDIESIKGRINTLKGIIDNSSTSFGNSYNKNSKRIATFSIRIPKNSFDSFINYIQMILNITYKSESVEDVTDNYEDIQNKKESLILEEEKLNQWIKDAKNLDDLLKIEEKLSSVRSEIKDIENTINNMDKVINYSTCNLVIEEVVILSQNVDDEINKDIKEIAIKGFKDNLEHTKIFLINMALYIFTHLPAMGVLVAFLAIVILIVFFMRLLIFGTKRIRDERLEKRIQKEREREEKRIQKEERRRIKEDEKRQEKENLRRLKEERKYNKKFEAEEKKNFIKIEKQIENDDRNKNYAAELKKRQEEKKLKQEERKKEEEKNKEKDREKLILEEENRQREIELRKEEEKRIREEKQKEIQEKIDNEKKQNDIENNEEVVSIDQNKENIDENNTQSVNLDLEVQAVGNSESPKDVYDAFNSVDKNNEVDLDFENNKE